MIDAFLLLGITLLLGFLAVDLFKKTKISEVIILIIFGFLVGYIGLIDVSPGSIIQQVSPFLGTLALILILFDGGINLNIFRVTKEFPRASLFTFAVFLISAIITGLLMQYVFGWELIYGILLGCIAGGINSAIVIAMVEKISIRQDIKTMLILESTLTDVLVVLGSFFVIEALIAKMPSFVDLMRLLASNFSISIVAGVLFGIIWLSAMASMEKETKKAYAHILTVAITFIIYSLINLIGGNGHFAVFVFALVLGNVKSLAKIMPISEEYFLEREIWTFHKEITFFVRTFFFMYIGLMLVPHIFEFSAVSAALLISFLALITRYFSQKFLIKKATLQEKIAITLILPRGLSAAVMALYAASKGITVKGLEEIVLAVILITNIIATIGTYYAAKKLKGKNFKQSKK
ncbi:hypothetical protein DRJ19_01070 [Candidatus Woesearchaeota archaeon]|nr:MAG: hypothetical protein DRJ19_01070 [Candidatus Woesearchaeota archaeon]